MESHQAKLSTAQELGDLANLVTRIEEELHQLHEYENGRWKWSTDFYDLTDYNDPDCGHIQSRITDLEIRLRRAKQRIRQLAQYSRDETDHKSVFHLPSAKQYTSARINTLSKSQSGSGSSLGFGSGASGGSGSGSNSCSGPSPANTVFDSDMTFLHPHYRRPDRGSTRDTRQKQTQLFKLDDELMQTVDVKDFIRSLRLKSGKTTPHMAHLLSGQSVKPRPEFVKAFHEARTMYPLRTQSSALVKHMCKAMGAPSHRASASILLQLAF